MDYERRMAAYAQLLAPAWQRLNARQAAPLLHHCLHDLRNAGERNEPRGGGREWGGGGHLFLCC
jgi:hypothetical protein